MERNDNLDISWLMDDGDRGEHDHPEPSALMREALDELEAALEDLRDIIVELGDGDGKTEHLCCQLRERFRGLYFVR